MHAVFAGKALGNPNCQEYVHSLFGRTTVSYLCDRKRDCFRNSMTWTKAFNRLNAVVQIILLLPMEYGLYYYCNERSRTPMHDDAGCNRKQLTSILFVQQNQMKICRDIVLFAHFNLRVSPKHQYVWQLRDV